MKEKTPKFKKGKPGRRIRSIDPYMGFTPFIMKTRGDASNYFRDSFDVSAADKFLHKKRAEGYKGMGMLHLFVAAYVRTVSQKPAFNRYITGERVYAHKDIEVIMSVKKDMSETGLETSIKVKFDPRDTINEVYEKMNAEIDKVKEAGEETSTDKVAGILYKLPRFLFNFALWLIRVIDYFHALPQWLLDASPFHGSLVITDLGSLGIPPIYHHLYNFGNVPVFIAIGAKRHTYELGKNGEVETKRYMDYTVSSDERICDGFYYSQGLKMLRSLLRFPEQLDTPPEEVFEDIY